MHNLISFTPLFSLLPFRHVPPPNLFSTVKTFALLVLLTLITPTHTKWIPVKPYTEYARHVHFDAPSVDVRKYVCKGANNTEIVIGGDKHTTKQQLSNAREIFANLCHQSLTFRRVLQSRANGIGKDRNYMQYTISARPGQKFSYGSPLGLGIIDVASSGQSLKFPSSDRPLPNGLSGVYRFIHDNFVSITAHESLHMGPGFKHGPEMYLGVALIISEMKAFKAKPPRDADPVPNPLSANCQTLGLMKYIQGEGSKCALLPEA